MEEPEAQEIKLDEVQEQINAEGERLLSRYKLLVQENNQKANALQSDGAGLDPVHVLQQRLELFIEHIMPMNSLQRLHYEITWQTKLGVALEQARGEVARAKLLAGGHLRGVPRRS